MMKLSLKVKMIKLLATGTAGITLLTTGCFNYEKQPEDVAVQPVGYSSDVDSTTVTKEDSTSEFNSNIVTRPKEVEGTALRADTTDLPQGTNIAQDDDISNKTTTVANDLVLGTTVFTNNDVKVTTAKEDKNYNNATDVVYSTTKATKPVTKTTTKVTIKTTKSTKATTKATTTTTTTTTAAPVTEPPVTEPEPVIVEPELPAVGESLLDKAMYDPYAMASLSRQFRYDLIHQDGATFSLVDMPYGATSGTLEGTLMVFAINSDCLVGSSAFAYLGGVDEYAVQCFEAFICNFSKVQKATKKRIKFEEYVKNPEAADLLNQAQDAFFNNNFDSFMANNMDSNIIYNPEFPGVNGILCGYDMDRRYYNEEDVVNNYLNPFVDRCFNEVYGHSFTK